MKSLTAAQMREADRRCIEDLGIPGVALMNSAGECIFTVVENEIEDGTVGIVCGKGNNGGDGFVVARLLYAAGHDVRVVAVAEEGKIKGDAAVFLKVFQRLGGIVDFVNTESEAADAMEGLDYCTVMVDALLGTGIQGEVKGPVRAAIDAWPDLFTVSVDLPSGMDADTGEVCGNCIRADITVTFQFLKRAFDNEFAKEYTGDVMVADIGIPDVCADDKAWKELMGE